MTWTEALRKGRSRWLMLTAICAALGCCVLVKGGTPTEFLLAFVIGAVNGIAVGFALGPAAEKGAMILSGLFARTPFYFIGFSGFFIGGIASDTITIVSIFLIVGGVFSLAQALRVRGHMRRNALR